METVMTERAPMTTKEFRRRYPDLFATATPIWLRALGMFEDEVDAKGPFIDMRVLRQRFQETLTPAEAEILNACPDHPMSAEDLRTSGVE